MTLVSRRSGKCAFCAFRSLIWLRPLPLRPNGRSFHQSSAVARLPTKRKYVGRYPKSSSYEVSDDHAGSSYGGSGKRTDTQGRARTQFQKFEGLILKETKALRNRLLNGTIDQKPIGDTELKGWGLSSKEEFKHEFEKFAKEVAAASRRATERGQIDKISNPMFAKLKDAYIAKDIKGLEDEIKHAFTGFTLSGRFSEKDLANHKKPMKSIQGLMRRGKACSLITGEERRVPEGEKDLMKSCTVEMVPLNTKVDVAVIDEIQMIGDEERGWAWTQAVLGVQAKEVHLCGEVRTRDLNKQLCAMMGDKLVIHNYERLGKLEVMKTSLNGGAHGPGADSVAISKLEKGDAVILFSRMKIHAMKNRIEAKHKGKRCAIVYGSLPPEPVLYRPLYSMTQTMNTIFWLPAMQSSLLLALSQPLDRDDHEVLSRAMSRDAMQMTSAGIFPPASVIERFAEYFPKETPFSYIMLRLHDIGSLSSQFYLCKLKDQIGISDVIQEFNLTIRDRLIFIAAPVSLRDPGVVGVLRALARCVADNTGGHILDIPELNLELLDVDPDTFNRQKERADYVHSIESLHKVITLYLWLSYRFTGVFYSQALAFHIKALVEQKIDSCLAKAEWQEKAKMKALKRNNKLLMALAPEKMQQEGIENATVDYDFSVDEVSEGVERPSDSETMLEDKASENTETSSSMEAGKV
ncbi:hypothetical protein DID88_005430 [Monilinia fructigena]|uniref:Uncharacterized protein n=1 Tax=Monilinia fructigena TaxID=38457 RepID=A0A395IZR4_9HELO|nr:hypothetical protein DID88_005430 [Monilinia fructigena]